MGEQPDYPVGALRSWRNENLSVESLSSDRREYRFRYTGSTCRDGGTPFDAELRVVLHAESTTIERAWVEFPDPQQAGVVKMCAYDSGRLPEALARPAPITGMTLAAALAQQGPVDYAGCLCYEPMRKDKWNMVLATIAYTLTEEEAT